MNVFKQIGNYFVESYGELKKVTWPSRKDTINLSIIVIISILISMLFLTLIDWGLAKIINLLIGG